MTKKSTTKKIEPKEWYSLQDIVTQKMMPWSSSFKAVRKIVTRDKENSDILRAQITGDGRATKYQIQGENIIKFIKSVEAGIAQL